MTCKDCGQEYLSDCGFYKLRDERKLKFLGVNTHNCPSCRYEMYVGLQRLSQPLAMQELVPKVLDLGGCFNCPSYAKCLTFELAA
jgi:hypothetical protein